MKKLALFICLCIQITAYSQTNPKPVKVLSQLATNNKDQTASFRLKGGILTINQIDYTFTVDEKCTTLNQIVGSIYFKKQWLRLVIKLEPQKLTIFTSDGKQKENFEF